MTNNSNNSGTRRLRRQFVATLAALFTVGCTNPFGDGDCVAIGVAGLTVTVVDAATNRPPAAPPTLVVTDGDYVEEHATPFPGSNPPSYSAAVERSGTYRVVVRAEGYQDYVLDGVRVTRGGRCDYLSGVRLSVSLVRAG